MRRLSPLVLLAASVTAGCNGLVGNDSVSLWTADAGLDDGPRDGATIPSSDATTNDASLEQDTGAPGLPVGIARQVLSNYSGTCLDVGTTRQKGSPVTLTVCGDLPEQLLVFRSEGAGAFTLFNPNSGLCIGSEPADGGFAPALQDCAESPPPSFDVVGTTGAWFIVSAGNLCFDDEAFGATNGAPVILFGCNRGPNQAWSVVP